MINFISGPVNSGKSTRLLEIYRKIRSGDGFYNHRCFLNNEFIGQDLVRMSTGENIAFSRIKGHLQNDWDEIYQFRKFSFSRRGFEFAEKVLYESIIKQELIFLDEIGPVELSGEGFFNIFHWIINNTDEAYVVCRDYCLEQVIRMFNVKEYRIIYNSHTIKAIF